MKFPIFLDHHSTTPMDPRVLEAMLPYFVEKFGNAASRNHAFGWKAEEAVETARMQLAKLIHADAKEIVFTSGATESDNLALKGVIEMYHEKGHHIITSSTEHRAVLDTAKALETKGKATPSPTSPWTSTAWSTRRTCGSQSRTRPCCSRSCWPTTRSGRLTRSRRLARSPRRRASCSTATRRRASARFL